MEVIMSKKTKSRAASFPYPVIATIAFLCLGFFWDLWHPGWLVFLTVPIYYYTVSLIESIGSDESKSFLKLLPYPLFCAIVYMCLGFFLDWWHPGWLIFLTIPIWSFFVSSKDDDGDDDDDDSINIDIDFN